MNADLENTLLELGPEYRELVSRLKSPFADAPARAPRPPAWWRQASSWLVAASLAVAFASAAFLMRSGAPAALNPRLAPDVYTIAYSPSAEAVGEMVRTQSPDGSWQNDFVTRQNAAALRDVSEARLAYRKAVRYLRSRGLSPMSDAEFREMADIARSM